MEVLLSGVLFAKRLFCTMFVCLPNGGFVFCLLVAKWRFCCPGCCLPKGCFVICFFCLPVVVGGFVFVK